jgi:cytochrome oxidase assembly protein ShyY1
MTDDRRRTVGLVMLAVVLAVTCSLLGRWQWNRHVARDAEIATIEANYDAPAVPLEAMLATPDSRLPDEYIWRKVTATGHYLPEDTVLLRNRPIGGTASFHVLVPFVVDSAGGATHPVLVVDRGWVPLRTDSQKPDAVSPPPSGAVTITVHLRQDEPPSTRSAPSGQVQAISVPQVLQAGGGHVQSEAAGPAYSVYGALDGETPPAATPIGALPAPDTDPGSHLSYAFQWWTFALGSLVGFGMLAVREARGQGLRPTEPARPRRSASAEEEEDALIETQLGG